MLMSVTWKVPALGDGVEEGAVAQLVATPGQRLRAGDTVLEIETDKVVMEVPAPQDGVLEAWLVATGDRLREGSAFASVTAEADSASSGEGASAEGASAEGVPAEGASAEDAAAPEASRSPGVSARVDTDWHPTAAPISPAEAMPSAAAVQPGPVVDVLQDHEIAPAGPASRRLARELGVELHAVTGSGRRGRITKDDIKQYVREGSTRGSSEAAVAGRPLPDLSAYGAITRQPLQGIGRAIAANMAHAWREVPHAWVSREIPIDELAAARARLRARHPQLPLTMTALLVRALAQTLREFPRFNASLDSATDELVLRADVHVGVAVDTPRGLLVPVLRQADRLSLRQTAEQLAELAAEARSGKLQPAALRGGSITLSNLGGLGAHGLLPMVNWPEVAIIGVGATRDQLQLVDGTVTSQLLLPVTVGFDHRVINGADAARLLDHLAGVLTEPLALAL
jgi:pyruvate dehydrogenase E2 component (dihydrolipoamide acetyltransferase)